MQLYSGKQGTVDKIVRNITKLLDVRGQKWDEKQKGKLKQRLQEKANKAARAKDYAKELLKDCKAWGGPCASCEDLLAVLSSRPDKSELIVKTEMAYYAQAHKQEKIQIPDLFRINKITYEEKLENLIILLLPTCLATTMF